MLFEQCCSFGGLEIFATVVWVNESEGVGDGWCSQYFFFHFSRFLLGFFVCFCLPPFFFVGLTCLQVLLYTSFLLFSRYTDFYKKFGVK